MFALVLSDDPLLDPSSFAYQDLIGRAKGYSFTPVFTSLTVVGSPTYAGRWHRMGRLIFFQASFLASTSVASAAGTTYITLPVSAAGTAGMATMTNRTANTVVGGAVIDTTNSRCYLPAQAASGNTFNVAGWYEVA